MIYQIETLSDLAKIPSDRLEACLRDLQYAIEMHHFTYGEGSDGVPFGPMEWADDDNHSVSMTFPNGEGLMLEVTEAKGVMEGSWPAGYRHSMTPDQHEAWNGSHYPGTRQMCSQCDQPTGRCEEDTILHSVTELPICPECRELDAGREA